MTKSAQVRGSIQGAVRHAPGRQEHSLCGMAFDAYDSGHAEEPIIFAQKGEMVTCDMCKLEIDHVRECFRGFRYAPNPTLNQAGGPPRDDRTG